MNVEERGQSVSDKWDRRFVDLARYVASWSKDPSTKTGAVIVDDYNRIVSVGYNGFPRGIRDDEERLSNRDVKLSLMVHCEINAIIFAGGRALGGTLYTWPLASCDRCAAVVIQAGVRRIVAPSLSRLLEKRWVTSVLNAINMFNEAGIVVTLIEEGDKW